MGDLDMTGDIEIGGMPNLGLFLDGAIDELMHARSPFTAENVRQLYDAWPSGVCVEAGVVVFRGLPTSRTVLMYVFGRVVNIPIGAGLSLTDLVNRIATGLNANFGTNWSDRDCRWRHAPTSRRRCEFPGATITAPGLTLSFGAEPKLLPTFAVDTPALGVGAWIVLLMEIGAASTAGLGRRRRPRA